MSRDTISLGWPRRLGCHALWLERVGALVAMTGYSIQPRSAAAYGSGECRRPLDETANIHGKEAEIGDHHGVAVGPNSDSGPAKITDHHHHKTVSTFVAKQIDSRKSKNHRQPIEPKIVSHNSLVYNPVGRSYHGAGIQRFRRSSKRGGSQSYIRSRYQCSAARRVVTKASLMRAPSGVVRSEVTVYGFGDPCPPFEHGAQHQSQPRLRQTRFRHARISLAHTRGFRAKSTALTAARSRKTAP